MITEPCLNNLPSDQFLDIIEVEIEYCASHGIRDKYDDEKEVDDHVYMVAN